MSRLEWIVLVGYLVIYTIGCAYLAWLGAKHGRGDK